MGSVVCVYRVLPKSIEAFEEVKKSLEALNPDRLEEEPVAFGLKAMKFTKIIPDKSGEIEKLENSLNSIKNANIEEISVSRTL